MANRDYDFIGFTYNKKHSIKDLGIYRVSNGDRYEEQLLPTAREKTASVDGQIGQYYFGRTVESKIIPVSFAFEDLSEEQFRLTRQTFSGEGIHDLIFDESPYKIYSAKVSGNAVMKYICFEVNGQRRYRGEGDIQFICFYPYAHTPKTLPSGKLVDSNIGGTFGCGLIAEKNEIPDGLNCEIIDIKNTNFQLIKTVTIDNALEPIYIGDTQYYLHSTQAAANLDINNTFFAPLGELSGKILNHYSIVDYPTKAQWAVASGLPLHWKDTSINCGDVPGSFKMTISVGPGRYRLVWGQLNFEDVEVLEGNNTIYWDAQLGLIYNGADEMKAIIPHKGHTTGSMQYDSVLQLYRWDETEKKYIAYTDYTYTIDYDYWYY